MLTGADLLAKVKELGVVSKSDLVRSCGYVSIKKDGTERLNFTGIYEALLEAKGMNFGARLGLMMSRARTVQSKAPTSGQAEETDGLDA